MMKTFGQRLRYLREQKKKQDPKWTQSYVADQLDVARTTYTAYENDTKQPPLDTINKIATLFNTSTDFLHGRTDKLNYEEIDAALKDPKLGLWFKDIKDASPEKQEELRQFWEFIKVKEKNRKPGDEQK